MMHALLKTKASKSDISNDNYCTASLPVSSYGRQATKEVWGEHDGCVFKVGDDMYFVPTKQVTEDDMLYITCDAQKIDSPMEGWRSRLSLGDVADTEVEDAILGHLHDTRRDEKRGEAFVITRDGKTFRL